MRNVFLKNEVRMLAAAAAVAGVFIFSGAGAAKAQTSCYEGSGYILDLCGSKTLSTDYEFYAANAGFFAYADGTNYLVYCQKNDLTIYNVDNPLNPGAIAGAHIPFDWTNINTGGDTHGPYVTHLRDIATTGGFRYAVVPLGEYGWDFLRISGTGAIGFLSTGHHPRHQLSSPEYTSAALFSDGVHTYAVAQKLDQASIDSSDNAIKIYQIGSATELTPGLGVATIQPLATVPAGSWSTPIGMLKFWVVNHGGSRLLYARRRGASPGLLIADISTPSAPTVANTIPNDAQLFGGDWGVEDGGDGTLWVADRLNPVLHEYVLTTTLGIPNLTLVGSPIIWWGDGTATVQGASVSVAGNLLVAGAGSKVGYLSLAGGGAPVLLQQNVVPYTDLDPNRICLNAAFSENVTNVAAFQVSGQHYVCRSISVDADIVAVGASCISTVPLPDFRVTGGSTAATCGGPAGYTQADAGFPGDTFTITDQSAGAWTTATLDIQKPLGTSVGTMGGQTFPVTITTHGQSVSWTPPLSTAPGDYYVVLSISGGNPPSTTKVISLCGNPQAALTVTVAGTACPNPASCTALIGDTVALGNTGTTGYPSANPTFLYQRAGGAVTQGSSFAPGAPPAVYTVGVVVPYGFPGSPDATCTGNALFAGFLPTNTYASCAVGNVSAGYGTASFQVEQPAGNKVADAGAPGSVNVSQAITLKFTGRIAGSYTPSFVWAIPNLNPAVLSCTYTAAPYEGSTCTIPASTLPTGPAADWNLTVNVCSAGGLGSPPTPCIGSPVTTATAAPVNVTPLLNSINFSANPSTPNVGQTVTITLGTMVPANGYDSLTISYGGQACDGTSQASVRCTNPFGQYVCTPNTQIKTFSYAASEAGTSKNIQITGYMGTATVQSPQFPITVGTTGSCPCATVSVSISGATSAQPNQTVSFTGNVLAGGPITNWAWTFGDGGTGSGKTVSHAWSGAGTYTVRLTATSSCGSVGIANLPITIGGGGGGNLSITPSPSTVDPGASVIFTFSPAVTLPQDSLTFNFGDGSPALTLNNAAGWCKPTSPCNTVRYRYTRAGTFTVTAGGTASGGSVTGSTRVTVRNNCQATLPPAASFTFAPEQVHVGEVVHFTDTSGGTPSAWSWNFGGSGTTSSVPVTTASLAALAALTITPNPANPGTGQPVTFTFSPAVTRQGDSVTFAFGDGGTKTMSFLAGLCSPTDPCNAISHTYTAAGTYTVSGSGTASGQSVSGSVGLTVTGGAPLTITPTPASVLVGQAVTFTLSPAPSQAGDSITLTFGDGSASPAIAYPACGSACNVATHTYSAAGTYTVTGSGTAGGAPVSGTATVQVASGGGGGGDGTSTQQHPDFTYAEPGTYTVTLVATNCLGSNTVTRTIQVLPAGADSVIAVDAAKVQGLNGTDWHADLRIFNPSSAATSVTLQFLAVGQDNTHPFTVGPYTPPLPPKGALLLDDILQWVKNNWSQDFSKAALRVTYENSDNVPPVVLVRTYNLLPDGSKYGQINSGVNVVLGTTPTVEWLTGLHNDGTTEGFRTNYSLVNLQGDPGGVGGINLTLYNAGGSAVATKSLGLAPYGYVQDSIKKLFGDQVETIGTFSLKIEIPQGEDIQTYASVMDNQTGDPVMIQAEAPPDSPIYLPAIGHLNGLGGTVWRADLQVTNPDSVAHTWEVRYTPKPGDAVQPAAATVTVEAHGSVYSPDLVEAVYAIAGTPISPDTATSGIVRIAPADGSNVYPIVAARAYNLTPNGTYGQGIAPLWAAKGVAAGEGRKLVLAGMSGEDIARTNVGFVNVSETQGVSFLVYFYGEDGTPLNPSDGQTVQPLSVWVGPGLWDQDKLENRFRNAFHISFPTNQRAVSAEIFVSSGGPGLAYATVIDSKTGDPNFIPAQLVP